MRRRRQKNTLLPKMLGLAVLINAILLPILAQFGVFKSIGGRQRLTQVELIKLPPAEKRPTPPKKPPKKAAAKPHPAGRKTAAHPTAARHAPSGPPPIKVVGIGPKPGGSGDGGTDNITTVGSGSENNLPVTPPVTPGPINNPPPTIPSAPPTPVVSTPPVVPASPPAAHIPTLTVAVPLAQPRLEIPDELRYADLNATYIGLFSVHTDGTATVVKTISGTGNAALDAFALDAARRWTFRPATWDGKPVESYLRLKIEFDVGA